MIWHKFCITYRGRNDAPNLSVRTAGSAHNDVRNGVPHTGLTARIPVDREREHHDFHLVSEKPGWLESPDKPCGRVVRLPFRPGSRPGPDCLPCPFFSKVPARPRWPG